MIEHLEVLVEDPSTEAALRTLLPRYLQGVTFEVYPHQGKDDLLKKLPQRLRGYAAWLPDNWRIVVLVDRDDDDCVQLKRHMENCAAKAGLSTPSRRANTYAVVNRIAIEELEAWYFGDWDAVREVFPKVSATVSAQSAYRDSDAISGGTWEAFERILQAGGYMEGGLRKTDAARAIAARMVPERNTSRSFQSFWRSVMC
jgi:hypothetical protein